MEEKQGMLISIACLSGSADDLSRAKLITLIRNLEANNVNDVINHLASIYRHPKSPYPIMGTIKTEINGLIVPSLGNKFIWVFVQDGGNVILDDFGSGNGTNRMDNFNNVCRQAMKSCKSVWNFAEIWQRSHHKTSIEALVHNYVNFVSISENRGSYSSWLGASGSFQRPPFSENKDERFYVGIDVSTMDNRNSIKGLLENAYYKAFINKHSIVDEITGRKFVKAFMNSKRLHPEAVLSRNPHGIDAEKLKQLTQEMLELKKLEIRNSRN